MAKGICKVMPSSCISRHEVYVNNSQTFPLGKLYSAAYFRLRGVLTNTVVPPPFIEAYLTLVAPTPSALGAASMDLTGSFGGPQGTEKRDEGGCGVG